ncbi:Uma2 family endonuclease [Saccharopolyspora sp. NPDC002376]
MNTVSWPDHLLTLDEFVALPEDNSRHYELQEGVLTGAPRPDGWHQRVACSLASALDDALPCGWEPIFSVEVVVEERWPPTVRVPDVAIVPTRLIDEDGRLLFASDLLGVVEVTAPGSRTLDTVTKRSEYAAAGIPFYWNVDLGPPVTLTDYRLGGDVYRIGWRGGGRFVSAESVRVCLDLDLLGYRRRSSVP